MPVSRRVNRRGFLKGAATAAVGAAAVGGEAPSAGTPPAAQGGSAEAPAQKPYKP